MNKKKKIIGLILFIGAGALFLGGMYLLLTIRLPISQFAISDQWVIDSMPNNSGYDYEISGAYTYLLYNAGTDDKPEIYEALMQANEEGNVVFKQAGKFGEIYALGVKDSWESRATPSGEVYSIALANLGNNALYISINANLKEMEGFTVSDNYNMLQKKQIDGLPEETHWIAITPTVPNDLVITGEYKDQTFEITNGSKIRSEMWWMMG